MSRRPFDPAELDQPVEGADLAISELDRYVSSTAAEAPRGLSDRVLAAIESEPAPRRGLIAWLLAPAATAGGMHRFARASVLTATLLVAVAGALFAGQLASFVRNLGSDASPPPSVTESLSPTPSPSLDASPSDAPPASGDENASPEATGSPDATASETGEASHDETFGETPDETPPETTGQSSYGG